MVEAGLEKSPGFFALANDLARLVDELMQVPADLLRIMPMAAE